MFSLLCTQQTASGSWVRIATVRPRADGSCAVPARQHGQVAGKFIRDAAKFFTADRAAMQADYEFGSAKFRFTRF